MRLKKDIFIIVTVWVTFFGTITALGADKYVLPVLRYQYYELLSRLQIIEE